MHLDAHHRRTAQAIMSHPVSHNIEWRDVLSFLEAIGTVTEEHNGKFKIEVGGETETLERPHEKDINEQTVVDLRRMITAAGITAAGAQAGPAGHAILVLSYHGAEIYPTDEVGAAATKIVPEDRDGTLRTMHHKANNPEGWYGRLEHTWFADLAKALQPAGQILIIGNGKGHSNVTMQFTQYLADHDRELLGRIAGSVDTDEEDLTEAQLLALAREFYGEPSPRDHGDGRWGEN
jgi:hypothetical protein